jgi:integrase/recombinase XerD
MRADSRNLYRNHEKGCPHRSERRAYKKCRCPIWLDYSYAGKRICKSLGTRNWQEAEDLLRKIEADDLLLQKESQRPQILGSANQPQPANHLLEAACAEFLADAKARGLRDATLYKYRLLLRRLQAFALERGLRFVAEFILQILREFWASLPNRNTAARKRLEELRTFFRFCQDAGWISNNPAKLLKAAIGSEAPTEPFTDEEEERILTTCGIHRDGASNSVRSYAQRLEAFVYVILFSGLRIGDAVTLRRDSVVNGRIRLRTQKTGTEVYCPLPPSVIEKLELVQGTSKEYFFWTGTSKRKSAVGDWQRTLKKLFQRAGVHGGHAHRFRHTFAKNLLMAGVPVERVAVLMGHRSPAITLKHYSAWVKERQEQLEEDVKRVWGEKSRPKISDETPKRPESAIQPLYRNRTDWVN